MASSGHVQRLPVLHTLQARHQDQRAHFLTKHSRRQLASPDFAGRTEPGRARGHTAHGPSRMGCVRRSSALPPARVSSPLAHPALHPPSWEAPLRPQTHSHTPRPSCSSLRQHLPGVRQVLSSGRSSAQGASSPSLRGNILSPTAHRLGTLRQPRALSSRLPGNSSNNNSGSGSSGSQGIKAPGTSTTELPAAQPKQAGPSAPQQSRPLGLKEYHYATFFTILLAGVGFLAVLLYLQAGIEIQQAVGKVLKRLLKTVALRQVRCFPALRQQLSPGAQQVLSCSLGCRSWASWQP